MMDTLGRRGRVWVAPMMAGLAAWLVVGCGSGGGSPSGSGNANPPGNNDPTPKLTKLVITPATLNVAAGSQTTLTAEGRDQNDDPMAATVQWSAGAGLGSIDAVGVFTATATTSSASPATGQITASSGTVSATVDVTVVVGEVARVLVSAPSGAALDSLAPGQQVQFSATGEDAQGNTRGRIAITPTWTVQGGIGSIDGNGLLTCLQAGAGQVTATFNGQADSADVTIVNPSGVTDSAGATVQPGEDRTVTTASGFGVTVPGGSVQVSTNVVVQESSDAVDVASLNDASLSSNGTGVTVQVPTGAISGTFTVTIPNSTGSSRAAGDQVSYPLMQSADGIFVPSPSLVTLDGNGFHVQVLPITQDVRDAAVALGGGSSRRRPSRGLGQSVIGGVGALLWDADFTYQLGPLYPSNKYDWVKRRFTEGYGADDSHTGATWPTSGRVAIVAHGLNSRPNVWQKEDADGVAFVAFLHNTLGYDQVWGFHYFTQQSIADNGKKLADILGGLPWGSGQQVDIFAHSMGGLVSRYAIERVSDPSYVARLVTLGSPHDGSPLAGYELSAADLIATLDPLDHHYGELLLAALTEVLGKVEQGVADMTPGGGFLTGLNGANVNGRPAQPVYFNIAGDLDGNPPNWNYLQLLALVAHRSILVSDFETMLQGLLTDGDGVVPTDSANYDGLDGEAGNLAGAGSAHAAIRVTLHGEDVAHPLLPTSAQVRQQLRDWFTTGGDLGVGIH